MEVSGSPQTSNLNLRIFRKIRMMTLNQNLVFVLEIVGEGRGAKKKLITIIHKLGTAPELSVTCGAESEANQHYNNFVLQWSINGEGNFHADL